MPLSTVRPRPLAVREKQSEFRKGTSLLATSIGLCFMAVVSASLSANGQHGASLSTAVFLAIAIGAYPILKRAARDLSRRRFGSEFCVSLALGSALAVREYSVSLNLLLFAVLTKTIED